MTAGLLFFLAGCVLITDEDRAARTDAFTVCGLGDDAAPVAEGSADTAGPAPSVAFGRPADGETLSGSFLVELNIDGYDLDDPYDEEETGDGHYHFYVDLEGDPAEDYDGAYETSGFSTGMDLTTEMFEVEPGCHQMLIRLHGHDHAIYDELAYHLIELRFE